MEPEKRVKGAGWNQGIGLREGYRMQALSGLRIQDATRESNYGKGAGQNKVSEVRVQE
jgi:hypothetical protein